jgi:hypothetical protein
VYVLRFPRGRGTGLRHQADRFDLKEKIIVHKKSPVRITGTKSEQISVKMWRPIMYLIDRFLYLIILLGGRCLQGQLFMPGAAARPGRLIKRNSREPLE